jgi:hypothetical protein
VIHARSIPRAAHQAPSALRRVPRALAALALLLVTACAGGGGAAATPAPTPAGGTAGAPEVTWPIKTREHVDLWLHGYALLTEDTARVPLFRRGYRDEVVVEKNRRGITTALDTNRSRLRARFVANASLALNPQFVPLYFSTPAELQRAVEAFNASGGDPRRAGDQQTQAMVAFLGSNFPTPADREWLRVFYQSLADESQRFHHAWWVEQQRARAAALAAADTLWQRQWRPRLQPFLNGTQLRGGDIIATLPLGGEGRTITAGDRQNLIAVGLPARPADAPDVLYTFVHEAVGTVATATVRDNTTPAEQRSGAADRLTSAAQVRGGLLVLQRVAPDQAAGYARFYLRAANVAAGSDPVAALVAAFPLPAQVVTAMTRQIDVVLGGI